MPYQLNFSELICTDDPLADTIFGRPVIRNPETQALRQMVEWNDQCEHNHACYENSGHVPRLLIDVDHTGAGETVQLVKVLDEGPKKYVALSYSLGDSSESNSNHEAQFEPGEISIQSLPKMFQDAILVTRILGVQHIWIDALCLDGNRSDWEKDSEEVGYVYTNAYLTIAATGTGSVTDGLLFTRPARNSILLPYRTHDDGTSTDFITAAILPLRKEALGKYKEMTEEPISKDLWCFQERVLSRRVVHFASEQLFFECEHHFRSEDGFIQNQRYHTTAKELLAGPDWYREQTALGRWHQIVRAYGQRQLRMPSDRLPGMANIAGAFKRLLDDEYIAGLWKSSLVESLCWQSLRCKPMSEAVAPSWSWASVDGVAATSFADRTVYPIAIIHDVRVNLQSDSKPFGNITSASITIEGPVISLKLVERQNPEQWHMFLQTEDGGKDGFYAGFDTIDRRYAVSAEAIQKTKIFALLLANTSRESCLIGSCHPRETTCGLLVSYADAAEHALRRIGWFSTSKEYFSSVDLVRFNKVMLV